MTNILLGIASGCFSFSVGWSVCYFFLYRPIKKVDDRKIEILAQHNQRLCDLLDASTMSGTWKY